MSYKINHILSMIGVLAFFPTICVKLHHLITYKRLKKITILQEKNTVVMPHATTNCMMGDKQSCCKSEESYLRNNIVM
jgi:hypothetical protein